MHGLQNSSCQNSPIRAHRGSLFRFGFHLAVARPRPRAGCPGRRSGDRSPVGSALERAYSGLKHIKEDIKDYTCTMVKRERVDGKLTGPEYIFTKVRQEPFSVYMTFLKPDEVAGREAI
ncbi:MAG: DUF1571 domain-containing protein [Pirellulales bacterium]